MKSNPKWSIVIVILSILVLHLPSTYNHSISKLNYVSLANASTGGLTDPGAP